jgi:hypothetical protein
MDARRCLTVVSVRLVGLKSKLNTHVEFNMNIVSDRGSIPLISICK